MHQGDAAMEHAAASSAVMCCPACASDAFRAVGRRATPFGCDDAGGLVHPGYEIRECQSCWLHYKSHTLSSAALATYYGELDFAPFDGDYGFPTDKALLARLRRRPVGSRILDFGCSTGRVLRSLGPTFERFGVEINPAAAHEASRFGITILPEERVADGRAGQFDAIVIADVFEHLLDPTATLSMLAERLAPGGELLIVTGLADAVWPRALISEHWYLRIPGHLQMISRAHIDWLADAMGLVSVVVKAMSHYRLQPVRLARQAVQLALYSVLHLSSGSAIASLIGYTPGLRRAAQWTNLPMTDQRSDHVFVAFLKPRAN